jgi:hypothetical protein
MKAFITRSNGHSFNIVNLKTDKGIIKAALRLLKHQPQWVQDDKITAEIYKGDFMYQKPDYILTVKEKTA